MTHEHAFCMFLFINSDDKTEKNVVREYFSKIYCANKQDDDTFPFIYQMIGNYQQKEKELVAKLKRANYLTKYFCGSEIVIHIKTMQA